MYVFCVHACPVCTPNTHTHTHTDTHRHTQTHTHTHTHTHKLTKSPASSDSISTSPHKEEVLEHRGLCPWRYACFSGKTGGLGLKEQHSPCFLARGWMTCWRSFCWTCRYSLGEAAPRPPVLALQGWRRLNCEPVSRHCGWTWTVSHRLMAIQQWKHTV